METCAIEMDIVIIIIMIIIPQTHTHTVIPMGKKWNAMEPFERSLIPTETYTNC